MMSRARFAVPLLACLAVALPVARLVAPEIARAQTVAAERWRLLAEYRIPSGLRIGGVAFGGLSSIEYDAASGSFLAVSDDRAERGPARYYRLKLSVDATKPTAQALTSVDLAGFWRLLGPGGASFAAKSIDPEELRLRADGGFYLASEGDENGRPWAAAHDASGAEAMRFKAPRYHLPARGADGERIGARRNRSYEALTALPDGRVVLGLENALHQDGPAASVAHGAPVRITIFDPKSGAALAEHVYEIDPIAEAPTPADAFADAGLVSLLAAPEGGLYALERSFSVGRGNRVKLYRTSFDGATDVLGAASLKGLAHHAMSKTLVFDFEAGTQLDHVDNLEGVTFGPLVDGAQTLVLISDDNFNRRGQYTQIIVLVRE